MKRTIGTITAALGFVLLIGEADTLAVSLAIKAAGIALCLLGWALTESTTKAEEDLV